MKRTAWRVADAWLAAVLSAATREANPALAGMVREMFLSNDARSYALHCLALRDGSVRDHPNILCPTLLTVGDQDPVTPLRCANGRSPPGLPTVEFDHPKHRALDHAGIPSRIQHRLIGFLGDA